MAFSHPEVYLAELAGPLCRRFEAEPTSYELAIASCIILFHFADVVAHVRGRKPHEIADEIAVVVPAFHTVRAIANAGKHVELTYHPVAGLRGLRAEHLTRGRGAAFSDGSFFSDGSTFSDMAETIVVQTPDRVKHDVLHVCTTVLAALIDNRQFQEV